MLRAGGAYVAFQLWRNVPVLFISQPDCICDLLSDDNALRNRPSPTMHAQEMDDTYYGLPAERTRGRCHRLALSRMPKVLYKGAKIPLHEARQHHHAVLYDTVRLALKTDLASQSLLGVQSAHSSVPRSELVELLQPCRDISCRFGCREPVGPRAGAGTGVTSSEPQ
jgi:hypothetical protein